MPLHQLVVCFWCGFNSPMPDMSGSCALFIRCSIRVSVGRHCSFTYESCSDTFKHRFKFRRKWKVMLLIPGQPLEHSRISRYMAENRRELYVSHDSQEELMITDVRKGSCISEYYESFKSIRSSCSARRSTSRAVMYDLVLNYF